ncbi:class I SAM-dependent methyltransferase [Nocardioides panacisoli]
MALFDVSADSYVRFMGRFSAPLATSFADFGLRGLGEDMSVLDVGCGPGMLTAELVRRLGDERVSAVDPQPSFIAAVQAAYPEVDAQVASAEDLPHETATFGATLAQLVVHFMADPARGVQEMKRVTVPGGRVSACVWAHADDSGPLSGFWRAVQRIDPGADDESGLTGSARGEIVALFEGAGLREVTEELLTVALEFATFEEWWLPFTEAVGPAGAYVARLGEDRRERLVTELRREYGEGPFSLQVAAWAATGRV